MVIELKYKCYTCLDPIAPAGPAAPRSKTDHPRSRHRLRSIDTTTTHIEVPNIQANNPLIRTVHQQIKNKIKCLKTEPTFCYDHKDTKITKIGA